jgi:hypothetical protein
MRAAVLSLVFLFPLEDGLNFGGPLLCVAPAAVRFRRGMGRVRGGPAQHLETRVLILGEKYCSKMFAVRLEVVVLVRFCLAIRQGSSRFFSFGDCCFHDFEVRPLAHGVFDILVGESSWLSSNLPNKKSRQQGHQQKLHQLETLYQIPSCQRVMADIRRLLVPEDLFFSLGR